MLAASVLVDDLFRSQTLPKIETLLSDTRRDVEDKKRELREKVGNRYREVLASSDSIASMHDRLHTLQDLTRASSELRINLKEKLSSFHEGRADNHWRKVKDLVDLPSRVQQAIGSHQFVQATHLLQEPVLDLPEEFRTKFRVDALLADHRNKVQTFIHVLRTSCLTAFDEPISLQSALEALSVSLLFETEEVDYLAVCFGKWNDAMQRCTLVAEAIIHFESTVLASQCFHQEKLQACTDSKHLSRIKQWSNRVGSYLKEFIERWRSFPSSCFPTHLSPKECNSFVEQVSEDVWNFRHKKGWSSDAWAVTQLPDSLHTLRRQADSALVKNIQARVAQCRKPLDCAFLEAHVDAILCDVENHTHNRHALIEAVLDAVARLIMSALDTENCDELMLYSLYRSITDGKLSLQPESPCVLAVLSAARKKFALWAEKLPTFTPWEGNVRGEDTASAFMWGTVTQQGRSLTVPVSASPDLLDYLFRLSSSLNEVASAPMALDAIKQKLRNFDNDASTLQHLFDAYFLLLLLGDDFSPLVAKTEASMLSDPVDKLIYSDLIKRLATDHLAQCAALLMPFQIRATDSRLVAQVSDPMRQCAPFQLLPVAKESAARK